MGDSVLDLYQHDHLKIPPDEIGPNVCWWC